MTAAIALLVLALGLLGLAVLAARFEDKRNHGKYIGGRPRRAISPWNMVGSAPDTLEAGSAEHSPEDADDPD